VSGTEEFFTLHKDQIDQMRQQMDAISESCDVIRAITNQYVTRKLVLKLPTGWDGPSYADTARGKRATKEAPKGE
jgi:hypothetical protein